MLSDDDCLTPFSLSYIIEIIQKTQFDFLLSRPLFTPDIHIDVIKTEMKYHVYNGITEFVNRLHAQRHEYQYLVSYFSFNSIMVAKSSYWNSSYQSIDKDIMLNNEFPQDFPPYYDLKDKKIVFVENTLTKGRVLNASYGWTTKLVKDFKIMMDYIEKQNDLGWLQSWKAIKKRCVSGWSRTIYLWILMKKLRLDYKKPWFIRWLYVLYKKHLQ